MLIESEDNMFPVAFRKLILLITASIEVSAACECERCSCECNVFDRLVDMKVDMLEVKREMKTFQERFEADLKQRQEDMNEFQAGVRQEIMNINRSLENVTTPLVAFSAYNPADETLVLGKVVVFQSVFLNAGTGYDTETGVFTAPVRGLYQFSAHLCHAYGKYMVFSIYLDEIQLAVSSITEDKYSICGSVSALTMAEAGQRITVRSALEESKLFQNIHRRLSFIGFLVHS